MSLPHQCGLFCLNEGAVQVKNKKIIRAEMRERRRSLTLEEQSVAAMSLSKNLFHYLTLVRASRIAAYVANDGEIDPFPALMKALEIGCQCFLPVLFPGRKPRVRFACFSKNSKFIFNRYGILEPSLNQRYCIDAIQLEWILIPLVAFDRFGNRVGMGGGYYDSTLASVLHRKNWKRPRLVGLAYEFQQIEKINQDQWDVPMHGILTEKGFYRF